MMDLHFTNSCSIFNASLGAKDFFRLKEFIPAERALDLGSGEPGSSPVTVTY